MKLISRYVSMVFLVVFLNSFLSASVALASSDASTETSWWKQNEKKVYAIGGFIVLCAGMYFYTRDTSTRQNVRPPMDIFVNQGTPESQNMHRLPSEEMVRNIYRSGGIVDNPGVASSGESREPLVPSHSERASPMESAASPASAGSTQSSSQLLDDEFLRLALAIAEEELIRDARIVARELPATNNSNSVSSSSGRTRSSRGRDGSTVPFVSRNERTNARLRNLENTVFRNNMVDGRIPWTE